MMYSNRELMISVRDLLGREKGGSEGRARQRQGRGADLEDEISKGRKPPVA